MCCTVVSQVNLNCLRNSNHEFKSSHENDKDNPSNFIFRDIISVLEDVPACICLG